MRDERNLACYNALGWKVLVIWECALKGKTHRPLSELLNTTAHWLRFESKSVEIKGSTAKSYGYLFISLLEAGCN